MSNGFMTVTIADRERIERERKRREAERKRQELEQAKIRCAAKLEKLRRIEGELIRKREFAASEAAGEAIEDYLQWEAELDRAAIEARRAVRGECEDKIVRQIEQRVKRIGASSIDMGDTSRKGYSETRLQKEVARRVEKVKKLAGEVSCIEDEGLRTTFIERIEEILNQQDGSAAGVMLLELKSDYHAALERESIRRSAVAAIANIEGLTSGLASQARFLAERASSEQELREVRKLVEEAKAQELTEIESELIRETVLEVFDDMGYDIAEGFENIDFGQVAYAQSRDDPAHAIRVQLNADASSLYTRIVSNGSTTPDQDLDAEIRICPQIREAAKQLDRKGVKTTFKYESGPGTHPMEQQARPLKKSRNGKRGTRRQTNRERHS